MGLQMWFGLKEFRVPKVQEQQTIRKESSHNFWQYFQKQKKKIGRWQTKESGLNFTVHSWLQEPDGDLNGQSIFSMQRSLTFTKINPCIFQSMYNPKDMLISLSMISKDIQLSLKDTGLVLWTTVWECMTIHRVSEAEQIQTKTMQDR